MEDASAYFNLLKTLEQNNQFNLDLLNDYVKKLYAEPNNQADDTLQIMTIHNAKGLEFDTVILPHLERKASNDEKQLLLWMERTRENESDSLILAPVHAIGEDTDSIYEYIKREQAIKNSYEKSRLLYVAVTRAKKHLALFFNLKTEKKVDTSSLLEKLLPSIQHKMTLIQKNHQEIPEVYTPFYLKRLPVTWKNPIKENRLDETIAYHQKQSGFLFPDHTLKHAGTLTHQILEQISRLGFDWWESKLKNDKFSYLKNHLLQLGVNPGSIEELAKNIYQWIDNTLQDSRGRWILSPHREAQSEFQLTVLIDSKPIQCVIDRTFIDENNIRWIIDYKTTIPENLDQEQEKYKQKMGYYFLALKEMDPRPIRMGLYFPAIPAWHEFEKEKNYENLES